MNDKIKMFERYLKETEKAENTIDKYPRDINEFYEWFKLVGLSQLLIMPDLKDDLESLRNFLDAINYKMK